MRSLSLLVRRGITFPAIMIGLAVFFMILGCSDSPCDSPCPGPACFEVHEWGVMVGCREDTSFFMTSRPEVSTQVDIPVLYFHSEDRKPFTARVRFADGRPTATYPEATVSAESAVWSHVRFSQDAALTADTTSDDYVPLEQIIDTLNDVDADMLEYGGVRARFLFYEGVTRFRNEITAMYSFEHEEATVRNLADYPCCNVILVAADMGTAPFEPPYVAQIAVLDPGVVKTVEFKRRARPPETRADLISLGFTPSEARSFSQLWDGNFFYRYDAPGWANLVYRLPQREYDELISLDIDPEPDQMIRAMYVLVHLSE